METYKEIKNRQQVEVNNFPFSFAFSNDQFAEMMTKWGLDANNKEDLGKIVSIGAGGFVRKKDINSMEEMFKQHKKELKEFRKNRAEFKKAVIHEMFNIEYVYDNDNRHICDNLGIDVNDFEKDIELQKIFREAKKEYYKNVQV